MQFASQPLKLADHESIVVVCSDLSEIVAAQEAWSLLAAIVESSNDAIIGMDFAGLVQSWNGSAERLFQYTAAEMTGQPFIKLLPSASPDEFARNLELLASGQACLTEEQVCRRKDGSTIEVACSLFPVREAGGEAFAVSSVLRDLTAQKAAELEIRNLLVSKERLAVRLQAMLDSVPCGILVVNREGILTFVNETAASLCRAVQSDLLGRRLDDFVPAQSRKKFSDLREAYFRSPYTRELGSAPFLVAERVDGSSFEVDMGLTPVETDEGLAAIVTVVDVTMQKQAAEAVKLAAIVEQRDQFLAMLSHDLKNPLIGSQRLFASLLAGQAGALTALQRQYLEMLQDSDRGVLQLIYNVLDVYRAEGGAAVLHKVSTNLETLIRGSCQEIAAALSTRNIRLEMNFACELEPIYVDVAAIHRVLLNLLDNAQKYTPEGGLISVSTAWEQDYVLIEIRDTGPGVPEAEQANLFKQFWQADAARTYKVGSGLGLFVCKQIVGAHGGEISYRTGESGGAVFSVRLPTRQEISREGNAESGDTPITILIVDDVAIIRFGLRALLQQLPDMRVIGEAATGQAALRLVREQRPKVVLLDIELPDLSGTEVCRQIKTDYPDTAVLMLTSHDDPQYVLASRAAGADGFCLKDISEHDLERALKDVSAGEVWFDPRL